jgi:primosomal replication protein N
VRNSHPVKSTLTKGKKVSCEGLITKVRNSRSVKSTLTKGKKVSCEGLITKIKNSHSAMQNIYYNNAAINKQL